jgi:uncharacterized protein YuzE
MELTYDPRYNIAYIRLRERMTGVETIQISESVNLDLAPDGTLYGIELLNANEQLGGLDSAELRLVNEASGKEKVMVLP